MTVINFNQILHSSSSTKDNISVDNPRRELLKNSIWQSLIHYKERNTLDEAINTEVHSFFQERFGFSDKNAFERIWMEVGTKVWTPKTTLTAGIIRDIDRTFRKELIYHGEGIHSPKKHPDIDHAVKKFVKSLLHGQAFSPRLIDKEAIRAILIKQDKGLMKQFQQELQNEMDHLSEKLPVNAHEEIVWRAFLGNILALLPYSYPETHDTFVIPILENGVCRKVNYHTEVIPLDYNKHSSPMIALGLTPQNDAKAESILSYTGTTFPAGSGFTTTLLADFTPGYSVGGIIYKRNKKKIDQWLLNKTNVHVVGTSLGGAMTFHTLRHHHDITRIDAYNPPGLYQKDWKKGVGSTCNVNIYCQPGDIVSKIGVWPTGDNVSLLTVYPHQEGMQEDPLSAHARVYTGCEKISIIKEDPKKLNQSLSRYVLTKLNQLFSPFVFFIPISGTLMLYNLTKSVHKVSRYYFQKILYQ